MKSDRRKELLINEHGNLFWRHTFILRREQKHLVRCTYISFSMFRICIWFKWAAFRRTPWIQKSVILVVRGRARILENLVKVKQLNKLILTIKHFTRVFFSHYLFPSKATRNHFKCYENNILLQYVRTKLTGTASKLIWKWPFFERFFFYFIELLFAEVTDWAQSNNSWIFAIKKRLFQNKNKKKTVSTKVYFRRVSSVI